MWRSGIEERYGSAAARGARGLYDGIVPERAASMLNPRLLAVLEENFGGSIRVKGEAVRRRLRIPMRLRVGERPAGALRRVGLEIVVLRRGAGERAGSTGRCIGDKTGFKALENSVGDGGALVRK